MSHIVLRFYFFGAVTNRRIKRVRQTQSVARTPPELFRACLARAGEPLSFSASALDGLREEGRLRTGEPGPLAAGGEGDCWRREIMRDELGL